MLIFKKVGRLKQKGQEDTSLCIQEGKSVQVMSCFPNIETFLSF